MLLLRPYYGVTNPGVISHGVAPRWSQNTVLILLHGLLVRASYLERPRYVNAMFLSAAKVRSLFPSYNSFLPMFTSVCFTTDCLNADCLRSDVSELTL